MSNPHQPGKVFVADAKKKLLIEKATINKPDKHPADYDIGGPLYHPCFIQWENYHHHISTLKRYPATWLTEDIDGKEFVEGIDFYIGCKNDCDCKAKDSCKYPVVMNINQYLCANGSNPQEIEETGNRIADKLLNRPKKDCDVCGGTGLIVEDEFQKNSQKCYKCFPQHENLKTFKPQVASPLPASSSIEGQKEEDEVKYHDYKADWKYHCSVSGGHTYETFLELLLDDPEFYKIWCSKSPSSAPPISQDDKDFIIQGLEEGSEMWKAEYDNCLSILTELVYLKNLKDSAGKTEEYEQRQPLVWIKAKKFLEKYQHQ